jgi:hypothetical protein
MLDPLQILAITNPKLDSILIPNYLWHFFIDLLIIIKCLGCFINLDCLISNLDL